MSAPAPAQWALAGQLADALQDMLKCSQPQNSMKPGFVYIAEAQEKVQAALAAFRKRKGGL